MPPSGEPCPYADPAPVRMACLAASELLRPERDFPDHTVSATRL